MPSSLQRWPLLSVLLLAGCALPPIELNNFEAERSERLARDPELAADLEARSIPQDAHYHLQGAILRLHDRITGDPIGWSFSLGLRCAWPLHELPGIKRARPIYRPAAIGRRGHARARSHCDPKDR